MVSSWHGAAPLSPLTRMPEPVGPPNPPANKAHFHMDATLIYTK
jgi:hypothetical protein